MKYHRVCVTLYGYAVVPGETEEEVFANIKKLDKSALDIEDISEEILEGATILEECTADGGAVD